MGRLAEALKAQPKYRARATSCGVHVHASKKEASRCQELQLLLKAGEICALDFQPRYDLVVDGMKICSYVGDFRYCEKIRRVSKDDFTDRVTVEDRYSDIIVEDCKGFKTPAYRLKRKLMKALFDIDIRET